MDKTHIAEWISIIRDIILNEENQVIPGVEMVGVVSRQGFTPDAIRFARANPIGTYIYNEKTNAFEIDIRVPLLLFEQRGPTDFVQVSPTEEDVNFFESYRINLYQPYELKFPKDWSFEWILPDI